MIQSGNGPPEGHFGTEVEFRPTAYRAEMALAATLLPSGRVRSVMARTTRGLARAGSFTSSETCMCVKKTNNCYFTALVDLKKQFKWHHVAQGIKKSGHPYSEGGSDPLRWFSGHVGSYTTAADATFLQHPDLYVFLSYLNKKFQRLPNNVWCNSCSSPSLSPPDRLPLPVSSPPRS